MSAGALSKSRLQRLRQVMSSHVERGFLPGAVALVGRWGESHVEVLGTAAFDGTQPMRRETIFRVSSMTKPVIAVAAMTLVEECRLRLDEPVDGLLPELANRRVLKKLDGPLDETVPAKRPITLRDLLTFTMGFGLILDPQNQRPIQRAAEELKLGAFGPPKPLGTPAPDEWMKRFGTLPLMHQPGERWSYNTGFEVLGVLIARASGQRLETLVRERIFEPLGMKDTGFSVPPEKLDRLATSYWTEGREVYDEPRGQWSQAPAFPSGGAGLVSTVDDFFAFGEMLRNEGRHGTRRVLSRLAVEAMTTDQLMSEQRALSDSFMGWWKNHGWGFGVSMVTKRDDVSAVPGRFGWDGGLGTSWASDPKEGLTAILMTQRAAFPLLSPVYLDFWTSVYQAIDD